MNDLEAREQRLLAGARRALSPQPSDQQRLLAVLGGTLALPQSAPPPSVKATEWFRVALGASALGLAALGGYGWGYRAGSEARPAAVVTVVAPPSAASSASAEAPRRAEPPVLEPQAVPREEQAPHPAHRSVSVSSAPAIAAPSGRGPAESAPGLDEEVRELRRIERALREGNPRLALVIAENLERSMPHGQLRVERRAASLMASCELGIDGAQQAAARFLDDNRGSAYAARLRDVCELSEAPQRTSPASGTDETRKVGGQ